MAEINANNTDVLDFLIESVKNLVGIDHVIESDDFFILGADSLAAIELISLIHKQYHIKLELIALFENRTLINLSNAINERIQNKQEIANASQE